MSLASCWSNDLQMKALEDKEKRAARRKELAYDRRQAPSERRGVARLWGIRKRAEVKGIEFSLTLEWMEAKKSLSHCEATGLPFVGVGTDAFGMTIDRKDSSKGYTPENCWAVCWIYNRAKLDGTHEELMVMARALVDLERAGYDRR